MTANHTPWRTTSATPRLGEGLRALVIKTTTDGRRFTEECPGDVVLLQVNPATGDTRCVVGFRSGTEYLPADQLDHLIRVDTTRSLHLWELAGFPDPNLEGLEG